MKAIRIHDYGDASVLKYEDAPAEALIVGTCGKLVSCAASNLMTSYVRRRCKPHPHGDMIATSPAKPCSGRRWLRDPSRSRLLRRRGKER